MDGRWSSVETHTRVKTFVDILRNPKFKRSTHRRTRTVDDYSSHIIIISLSGQMTTQAQTCNGSGEFAGWSLTHEK